MTLPTEAAEGFRSNNPFKTVFDLELPDPFSNNPVLGEAVKSEPVIPLRCGRSLSLWVLRIFLKRNEGREKEKEKEKKE